MPKVATVDGDTGMRFNTQPLNHLQLTNNRKLLLRELNLLLTRTLRIITLRRLLLAEEIMLEMERILHFTH